MGANKGKWGSIKGNGGQVSEMEMYTMYLVGVNMTMFLLFLPFVFDRSPTY